MLLVQGLASSLLFEPTEPTSPINRRISIIVMNREAEDRLLALPNRARPTPSRRRPATAPPDGRR